MINKNYRFKIESNERGIEVKVSDFQPAWMTIIECALLIGALGYTYLKLSQFFN